MTVSWTRRKLLGAAVSGGVASCIPASVLARAVNPSIAVVPLTDTLYQVTGAGSNVVVLAEPDAAVMVDGGLAEHTSSVLKAVSGLTKKDRVDALFNTHWHWDHTGSNEAIGRTGAEIIAHENTKLWLGADFYVYWQDRYYSPRPKEALPNKTFYKTGEAVFGKEPVKYGVLARGHTDGDIYIHFPQSNVLVLGDTLTVGTYPLSDTATGGWIGGMIDANKAMLDVADDETKIIPGTGPVQSRADLQAQHDMLSTVMDRLAKLLAQGMSAEEMVAAAPTKEFDEKWGDPTQFVFTSYRGLWANVFATKERII